MQSLVFDIWIRYLYSYHILYYSTPFVSVSVHYDLRLHYLLGIINYLIELKQPVALIVAL